MATSAQREALLAITCPWCNAAVGEVCSRGGAARAVRDHEGGVRRPKRQPITTLDGGCHDARWQKAGLGTAPVITSRVRELHPAAAVSAPAAAVADERPW